MKAKEQFTVEKDKLIDKLDYEYGEGEYEHHHNHCDCGECSHE